MISAIHVIIYQHNTEGRLIVRRKLMQKVWKVDRIQAWQLQEETLTSSRFDGSIHIEVLKAILQETRWFDHSQRHPSSLNRQPSKAAFVLTKDAYRALRQWLRRRLCFYKLALQ
jgi:hypothetical protein